ncbi:hypothetical protein R6Q59_000225 [Mikania micrantha]|uniref:Retrotransposon gag domain-containing protein n=1 Tax=Mikania micrantha TaxID=192012 RepID=A0A5N6Q6G7_9ASTR|nr:hypothetical protein E3N88_02677 [Mikania micrantha]
MLANLKTQLQFSSIPPPQIISNRDVINPAYFPPNSQAYPPFLDYSRPYKPSELVMKSKFIAPIALVEFHHKLKMRTNVEKYDGLTDPEDHYNVFVSAGGVEQWTMLAWCHMFVQTLVGAARIWFDSLPMGSIVSFEDLALKFKLHSSQQRRHTRDKTMVLNLRRGSNETVEEFIVCNTQLFIKFYLKYAEIWSQILSKFRHDPY